jgi:hypothetical protein
LYIFPINGNVSVFGFQWGYFEHPVLKTIIAGTLSSAVFLIKKDSLDSFAKKYGKILILGSVILFSLLHITNIRCAWYIYPFMIFMCLPQFVLGISVTNLRLNIGFWAGVLFHCAINFAAITITDGDKILQLLK